jgi:hypothetical protein
MAATGAASANQALLALYGALDQAVTGDRGAGVEAVVERYLPGTTGANAGWYDELLGFLGDRSRLAARTAEEPPTAPDLSQALAILQRRNEQNEPKMKGAEFKPLTAVQLSRMAYGIGALSHLPSRYPADEWDEKFARTLALTGPQGDELLQLLRSGFHDRGEWSRVMNDAAQHGLIRRDIAAAPLCETKPMWVRGRPCVVLTTEFQSATVSLDELKNVIDPLNWDKCLPFFCSMKKQKMGPDNWSRVLECVSVACSVDGTQMVTPLKYWKGPPANEKLAQSTAWVDYTIDDDPGSKGDGRMVVDEGFIRMTSTADASANPGVRVRTRKVAGFRNLAYVPAAIFACLMGYGDVGVEMLLGGVAERTKTGCKGWTNWDPSTPVAGASARPPDGEDITRRAVALAVEMANDYIDDMSTKSAALAAKWATGIVPLAETMTLAADLATRLATDPWRYLERLGDPTQGDK